MQGSETPENHLQVVKALRAAGFEVVGIRGSHHYLYHAHRDVIVIGAYQGTSTGKAARPYRKKSSPVDILDTYSLNHQDASGGCTQYLNRRS
jgi:hypothetical protein